MKELTKSYFPKTRKDPKSRFDYLLEKERMKGIYLGSCLDRTRWGSICTVMWEETTPDIIQFILKWLKLNQENLKFHTNPEATTQLPYVQRDHCPRNYEHEGTFKDQAGRLRCRHIDIGKLPDIITSNTLFDEYSQTETIIFHDTRTYHPGIDDDKRLIQIPCYAIISDESMILSLETILDRLNLRPRYIKKYCDDLACCKKDEDRYICPGHNRENTFYEVPFDGWSLAVKVKKWYEQLENKSKLPVYNQPDLTKITLQRALQLVA